MIKKVYLIILQWIMHWIYVDDKPIIKMNDNMNVNLSCDNYMHINVIKYM